MPRYMMIMRATAAAEAAAADIDFDEVIEQMGRYNEELINAGVLFAGEGLTDPAEGFVVDFDSDPPTVTDGPYPDPAAIFHGFWIIEVDSTDEAKAWARKVPVGPGVRIEVRRVSETSEFPLDNPWVRKEIQWKVELAEKLADKARTEAERFLAPRG